MAILIMMSEAPSMILKRKDMARKKEASWIVGMNATSMSTRARKVRPSWKTRRSEHRFNNHIEIGRNMKLEIE